MVSHATYLPDYDKLKVPQEIPLSTPSMKAAGPHMHQYCESKCKEFMLCRKEERDPRKCLAEGAEVTACGVEFLRKVKNSCRSEFDAYADCIDKSSQHCLVSPCYKERRPWDDCIRATFGMAPKDVGYFAKPHVHRSDRPQPSVDMRQPRDYKAEAAALSAELPADYEMPKNPRSAVSSSMDLFD